MFPPLTKRWWGSLDYPLYLPLHNLQMSIQHCPRGKSYDWQCSVIKMMRLLIVDYWRVTQTHQIDNTIILSDDYRRYSYSPDSAVEDSGRPSMSSTLPLPRSFMITMMTFDDNDLDIMVFIQIILRSRSRSSPYENDSGDQVQFRQNSHKFP